MSKGTNKIVLEDFLLEKNFRIKEKGDEYIVKMDLEGVKYPSSKIKILCSDEKIEFVLFPESPTIPPEKINDIAYYFRIINQELFLGQFEFRNEIEGEILPAYSIVCDTYDGRSSQKRIGSIFNQLCDNYKKFINGVLLIQYDIMPPLQTAELLKKG